MNLVKITTISLQYIPEAKEYKTLDVLINTEQVCDISEFTHETDHSGKTDMLHICMSNNKTYTILSESFNDLSE